MRPQIHLAANLKANSLTFQFGCIALRSGYSLLSALLSESLTTQEEIVIERLLQVEPREGFQVTTNALAYDELRERLCSLKQARTTSHGCPRCD